MFCEKNIIKNIDCFESIFEDELKSVIVVPYDSEKAIGGAGRGESIGKSMQAAVGEHIERSAVFKNKNLIYNEKMLGMNLKSYKKEYIKTSDISLFKKSINMNHVDSSGLAFHLNSQDCIRNAFFEFIERQSLVFSFNTHYCGTRIKKNMSRSVEIKIVSLYSYYDEVLVNNISIIDEVYVIIIVGYSNLFYGVGLGSDTNLEKAIFKAYNEIMSLNIKKIPKYFNIFDKIEINNYKKDDPFQYSTKFKNSMSPNLLKNSYNYLKNAEFYCIQGKEIFDVENIIKIFMEKSHIELTIVKLKLDNPYVRSKVVKIISKDCYPHIKNEKFDAELFKISYFLTKNPIFYNRFKYLPFP